MTVRIKICCLRDEGELEAAVEAGADAVGVVSAMPSGPGTIPDEEILRLVRAAPASVRTVLLTSRTDPEPVVEQVVWAGTTDVQLVRAVPPETHEALRSRLPGVRVLQVIHVEGPEAVERARAVATRVDAILLDSGSPGAETPELGGTGRVHDWSVSRDLVQAVDVPVWLAGGLNPENVAQAVRQVSPYGVDVCSGLRPDGRLERVLLESFVAAARGASAGMD